MRYHRIVYNVYIYMYIYIYTLYLFKQFNIT